MSLLINYRPPRITRKSYRPRASDRTMVDNVQPRSLSCFRIRKRRHENRMDLRRPNTPEPLNMTWAGERCEQLRSFQSPGLFFLLTLPFIERANRTSIQKHFSGNATNRGLATRPELRQSQSPRSGLLASLSLRHFEVGLKLCVPPCPFQNADPGPWLRLPKRGDNHGIDSDAARSHVPRSARASLPSTSKSNGRCPDSPYVLLPQVR